MYKGKEMKLRTFLSNKIVRGKVDMTIYYEADAGEKKVAINKSLMASYYDDLKEVADKFGQENVDYLGLMMRIPEVLKPHREEFDENDWALVMKMVEQAVDMLDQYRIKEGAHTEQDFEQRINAILELFEESERPLNNRLEKIKTRIKTNLDDFIDPEKIDSNRFEQELIYYIEKLDISEERVRLQSNCKHFLDVLESDVNQGKKLGFISQEIGREINTMGSKANDADVQRIVVKMKDQLEKIKEQVLNVL